ncbi:MAG: hypothetical protein OEY94_04490 [Alphaproteobacteria bacterium]|nr:hypothetical protein [Alphaproteobacteria bacterium]
MDVFSVLRKLYAVLVFILVCTVLAQGSEAGRELKGFSKPMPEIESLDMEKFKKEARLYRKHPYQQEELGYKIFIPKDWEQGEEKSSSNFLMNEKLFLELNIYYSKARMGGRSKIIIQAINMDYNLTAEQWYIKYILESGYTMEGFKVHSEKKVESLMIVMEDDLAFGLRTIAHINGKKMILVQYYLPLAYWEEEKAIQEAVMESFELNKIVHETIGTSEKFQFLDVAEVYYPGTWKIISKPFRTVERMSIKILNIKEVMEEEKVMSYSAAEGHVNVYLVSKIISSSLIDEIAAFRRQIEGTGLLVGDKLDYEFDWKYHDNVSFAITEVYEGIDSNSDFLDYELWFSVLVGGNYFYFITLLTPSAQENYISWARNTQGYKEIVKTLTPTTGSFVDHNDQ